MRLGMWNRAAVVATVIAMIALPLWAMADQVEQTQNFRTYMLTTCQHLADQKFNDDLKIDSTKVTYGADMAACDRADKARPAYRFNAKDFISFAAIALAFCAVVYGLIWSAVATARWVWAGRKVTT